MIQILFYPLQTIFMEKFLGRSDFFSHIQLFRLMFHEKTKITINWYVRSKRKKYRKGTKEVPSFIQRGTFCHSKRYQMPIYIFRRFIKFLNASSILIICSILPEMSINFYRFHLNSWYACKSSSKANSFFVCLLF